VTQETGVKTKCLEISPQAPQDLNGVIVLDGAVYYSPSYLVETSSGREIQVFPNDEPVGSFAVSPDGEWLAYLKDNASQPGTPYVVLTKSDGEPRYTLMSEKPVNEIIGWLDSQRLLLVNYYLDPWGPLEPPNPLIVLDPFIGQQQELLPDYPKIYYAYPPIESWGPTVYDPTLSLVVYPRVSEGRLLMALWNRETEQDIATLGGVVFHTPQWSPDGLRVAIVRSKSESQEPQPVDQEIFTLSRDGEITQLTNLSPYYSKVLIGPFSWSPDGRHIAFWLSVEGETFPDLYPDVPVLTDPVRRLAIVDTVTQEITNYCVPGSLTGFPPSWSPEGQGLLLENSYDRSSSPKNHVYVIDLVQGLAFQIAENLSPVGWMKSSP
jgi:dipeptidyl aminopeptidase/acylaminoacyl peptidase